MEILKINNRKEKRFLKRRVPDFDFNKMTREEIRDLIQKMRIKMIESDGMGLAANQVGLDLRLFVVDLNGKFYAIFNPEITKKSDESEARQEGCLSIPGTQSQVTRSSRVTLKGFDKNGKKIKIKAWGWLSVVFQHEMDHLNGKLITDYLK